VRRAVRNFLILGGAATPIDRLFLAGASAHPSGPSTEVRDANAAAALACAGVTGRARCAATREMMRRIYRS
jgi:hypothetical protein